MSRYYKITTKTEVIYIDTETDEIEEIEEITEHEYMMRFLT
mgnify:CR=1 FL=1